MLYIISDLCNTLLYYCIVSNSSYKTGHQRRNFSIYMVSIMFLLSSHYNEKMLEDVPFFEGQLYHK